MINCTASDCRLCQTVITTCLGSDPDQCYRNDDPFREDFLAFNYFSPTSSATGQLRYTTFTFTGDTYPSDVS